jgi:hypothetical protein
VVLQEIQKVPTSTTKYQQVSTSTNQYQPVPSSITNKYQQDWYQQVPTSTKTYQQAPTISDRNVTAAVVTGSSVVNVATVVNEGWVAIPQL